ncbi:MAG: DMT family transporter [Eubacteriaceae bacterium]|nr:DMT family transporter [Eubacteriaceae bacterium]
MKKSIKSNIMLFITALIWGSAFVAQKAATTLGPFTYNGIRYLIGGFAVILVIILFSKIESRRGAADHGTGSCQGFGRFIDKQTLIGGIACGIVLCAASNLQQLGMCFDTDAGKTGFITSLYIVIVPLLGMLFGKNVRKSVWICVCLGIIGFYMLTMAGKSGTLGFRIGDFFVLLCAFCFACHIMVIDHFAPKCECLKMSCVQFFVASIVSLLLMTLFETPVVSDIIECWLPILYCGIFSCGLAFTLQIIGQKNAEPTAATLILSLESVFAVIFGVLLAGESMTLIEGLGCIVIFIAVVTPQLLSNKK